MESIKLIAVDLDGVLGKEPCYASVKFEQRYGIPASEFYQIMKSNQMLKRDGSNFIFFEPLFSKYHVELEEDEFWNIWFDGYLVDEEAVNYLLSLSPTYKLAIVSDNFTERVRWLRQNYSWISKFDYLLFSCEIGSEKIEGKPFTLLLERSNAKPGEIYFTDDDPQNVKVAQSLGLITRTYDNLAKLKFDLGKTR